MESQESQNPREAISTQEFLRLKDEAQTRLMIDSGVKESDIDSVSDWIEANHDRFNKIFDIKMALMYRVDPSNTIIEIKNLLYQ